MAHTKKSIAQMLATRARNKAAKEAQIRAEAIVQHQHTASAELVEVETQRVPLEIPEFIRSVRRSDDLSDEQVERLARLLVAVVRNL